MVYDAWYGATIHADFVLGRSSVNKFKELFDSRINVIQYIFYIAKSGWFMKKEHNTICPRRKIFILKPGQCLVNYILSEDIVDIGFYTGIQQHMYRVAAEVGVSGDTVRRFIRLNALIPELQKKVDSNDLKFNSAVELSYLSESEQIDFLNYIESQSCSPSLCLC